MSQASWSRSAPTSAAEIFGCTLATTTDASVSAPIDSYIADAFSTMAAMSSFGRNAASSGSASRNTASLTRVLPTWIARTGG
jgi:hypothetical protein